MYVEDGKIVLVAVKAAINQDTYDANNGNGNTNTTASVNGVSLALNGNDIEVTFTTNVNVTKSTDITFTLEKEAQNGGYAKVGDYTVTMDKGTSAVTAVIKNQGKIKGNYRVTYGNNSDTLPIV